MRVPAKYLFYDGLPNAKDVDKIMADNGYQSPYNTGLQPDSYHPIDVAGAAGRAPNYSPIDDIQVNPGIDVASSVGAAPNRGMNLTFNKPPQDRSNPNNLGDYVNLGLGAASAAIPGERIHRNYVTQPLPVYNPYQYGTGSDAIMKMGGAIKENNFPNISTNLPDGFRQGGDIEYAYKHDFNKQYADGGFVDLPTDQPNSQDIMLESYDKITAAAGAAIQNSLFQALGLIKKGDGDNNDAKSGIHIKPSHKGRFTAYKKRTGQTTEEALHSKNPHVRQMANFARNAKKWHHAEAGTEIMLEPYDKITAEAGRTIMLEAYDKIAAAAGASLTPGKASEILHDGTANGHPLTPKQRRFMGWKAGSKADSGAQVTPNQVYGNSTNIYDKGQQGPGPLKPTNTLPPTPQSRTDAYLLDDINKTLVSGTRMKNTGYAPEQQKLLTDAYIWRQKNPTLNQNDAMKDYFDQQVDANNPMHMMRARLGKIGYGAMYNNTPNMDVRDNTPAVKQAPPVATSATSMDNGGMVEGSIHDLSEEQIAKMLKAGYKLEHFKD